MSHDLWRPAKARTLELRCGSQKLVCELRGEGPPLLLLHGWTLDQRMFTPQFDAFSQNFLTISFDRRGYGKSGGTPDLGRELEDIDTITEALCEGEVPHLLGMSQGGRIALRYAITRPGQLRSLILQGPALDQYAAPERDDERVPMEHYAELARAGELAALRRQWLAHPKMRRGIGETAYRLLKSILEDYDGADLLTMRGDSLDFSKDVLSALARVNVPTLIVTGSEETEARKQVAAKILELMPEAEEVTLEGCGHMSNLGDPVSYNQRVLGFLARH